LTGKKNFGTIRNNACT